MRETDREPITGTGRRIAGLSVGGALVAGAGGVLGAFVATVGGDFIAGAIYLAAAALAFGLLANAIFRH